MKNVIRTILAFYNGMEFIKTQVDSILAQANIENYEHQLYIYDDGSTKESIDALKEMYGDNKSIKIIDGVNEGPYYRYLMAFTEALKDKVDFVFFSDQDDYFYPHKYKDHIDGHNKFNKSMIISSDCVWDYKNDTRKKVYKNGKGHNFSIDINRFNDKFKYDLQVFQDTISDTKKHLISYWYHDSLLLNIFISINEVGGLWGNATSDHRVHSNSITKSGGFDNKPWRIWYNQYNYYFLCTKPFIKKVFGIDQNIKMFNYKYFFTDKNATETQAMAGWIRWKLDDFAMMLRWKWAKNVVTYYIHKNQVSKESFKATKKSDKQLINALVKEAKDYWSK